MSRRPREGEEHVAARIARAVFGVFGVGLALFSITMVTFAAGSLITGEDPQTERSTLMGLEESQAILNDFAAREVADLLVADDGTVVYDFNILSNQEKARAKELS